MEKNVRILFFSDSHLGFDMPLRPRIERRRRGHDFRRNFISVIDQAINLNVNAVVHGGDLFYRSRIPPELTADTFDILSRLPAAGIHLMIVPGNHERSVIPHPLLAMRPGIHLFSAPNILALYVNGIRLALGGFPFQKGIREKLVGLLHQTGLLTAPADFRFLCIHQAIESATVGVQNFTFRDGPDVVPLSAIPADIDAVLSGHIHRAQVLWSGKTSKDIRQIPFIIAGSIERTAISERTEQKGFFVLDAAMDRSGEKTLRWSFHPLPTRPMFLMEITGNETGRRGILDFIAQRLQALPDDAVVQIRFRETGNSRPTGPTIHDLRSAAPDTMNISIRII